MKIDKGTVIQRLESFGYVADASDDFALLFAMAKVTDTIKNECNVSEIPDGLGQIAVDMVCGEFLAAKKGGGQLANTDLDVEAAIKTISEGDTSITYAVGDGGITLDWLINWLISYGKSQFVTYRRLAW